MRRGVLVLGLLAFIAPWWVGAVVLVRGALRWVGQ